MMRGRVGGDESLAGPQGSCGLPGPWAVLRPSPGVNWVM